MALCGGLKLLGESGGSSGRASPHWAACSPSLPSSSCGAFICLLRNRGLHAALLALPFAVLMMEKRSRLRRLALILAALLGFAGVSQGLKLIARAGSGWIDASPRSS